MAIFPRPLSAISSAARHALGAIGHTHLKVLLLAVGVYWCLNLGGDGLANGLKDILWRWTKHAEWAVYLVEMLLSMLAVVVVWWGARRALVRTTLIDADNNPGAVRGLVMLLSPPSGSNLAPANLEQSLLALSDQLGDPNLPTAVEGVVHNWKMPVLAINHHLSRLEQVVFITSSGKAGSHAAANALIAFLTAKCPPGKQLALSTADEFLDVSSNGVDFTNPEAIFDRVKAVTEKMRKIIRRDADILIDVTGGTALASVMAATVSLQVQGRAFQYVDTKKLRVSTYDVTIQYDKTS